MPQAMYTLNLTPRLRGRRLLAYALALGLVAMLLLCAYTFGTAGGAGGSLTGRFPGEGEPRYGIILDAGSTGSRVHVFEFRYLSGRRQPYVLVNELFEQVKPGLSAFAREPRRAAASLAGLLEACKRRVPTHHWADTPLALKATAGLRLLKPEQSARILAEVRQMLARSPFVLDKDAVSIMDGLDEGIFSWVTLNFLNGRLAKPEDSYGALDLGGGSTQLTFALPLQTQAAAAAAPAGFVKRLSLGSDSAVQLYSHSYLGLGLMSARLSVLQSRSGGGNGGSGTTNLLALPGSPCLPSNYSGQWEHGGLTYNVSGGGNGGYAACRDLAGAVVAAARVHRPRDINTARFYAFSYFYDRAADVGLIGADEGGEVSLAALIGAAKNACAATAAASQDHRRPFLCLDLCYQTALLVDGYGFAPDTARFLLRKKIHNVELSWALGAVFDVFNSRRQQTAAATATTAAAAADAATAS